MIDIYAGRQIGHYRILRQLGKGAFATVYLAEHVYIEKLAAIKMLHIAMNEQNHRDFQEEARINARLEHPHIIRLLDFGFYEHMPYLVMEYAANGTLRQLYPKGSRISPQVIITYVSQIAEALDYAHQQNVIHRDVKPENLLLNSKNELVLSDFGIAVVQQTQQALSAQQIAGTPIYMAPEQFQGIALPASDQYALGIMVYEWLCGESPFSGNFFALSYQHIHQQLPGLSTRIPGISPAVDDVVSNALAKDPAHRFTSIHNFARALEKAFSVTQPSLQNRALENSLQAQSISPHAYTPFAPEREMYEKRMPAGLTKTTLQGLPVNIPSQFSSEGIPYQEAPHLFSQQGVQNQNRQRLVQRVRSFWITGVLEQSLEGAALMELDLQETPDAVANPWKQVVSTTAIVARSTDKRKSILQFYTEAGAELLILGAPGSGKTTVLLTLARDLLTLAEQNEDRSVPVIFNLSTWSHNQPLAAWLIDELDSKYQVHPKLGQQLIQSNQILPLLDGLDEVAIGERTACIEALNRYRREPNTSPLVVCSRSADYLAQEARVLLNKAVMIQPLSTLQANDYLVQAGDSLSALRVALQSETALRELTGTPLLLRMLALTYYNASVTDVLRISSSDEQIQHVLERYVERMLTRGSDKTRYSSDATKHWLAWLARQVQQRNQKIFYIERMQPDYIEGKLPRQRYTRLMVGLVFSVLGFFLLGPSWVNSVITPPVAKDNLLVTFIPSLALLLLLINGSLLGLINGMLYQWQMARVSDTPARQRWRRGGQRIVRGIVNILFIELFFNLPLVFLIDPSVTTPGVLISSSLFSSITSGVLLLIVDWLLGIRTTEIQPAESVAWSWTTMLRNFFKVLGLGLVCNVLFGLLWLGLTFILIKWIGTSNKLIIGLASGIGFVLFLIVIPGFIFLFALLKGLTSGVSTRILDARNSTVPNQGIRHSARNSLLIGLLCLFFMVGIPAFLAVLFKSTLLFSLLLIFTPLIIPIMMLRVGGIACIQHYVLRWLLWREGAMPWNYPRFLDSAAEHILLQKVGGGYMFVHRLLFEYFAGLETPPPQL